MLSIRWQSLGLLALGLVLLVTLLWSERVTGIAAGVALFLFGMGLLEQGMKGLTEGRLGSALGRLTDGPGKSVVFGFLSTAVMQSSSLVSLLTISLVSAQMISLVAGIGVVLGTNLGTTTGAWLLAGPGLRLSISAYALPLLVLGVVLKLSADAWLHHTGRILLGIGFLFLGIAGMQTGFQGLEAGVAPGLPGADGLPGLLLAVVTGMVLTVLLQSSHATLMLILAALASGQLDYEQALGLAIGANLGTTVTATLASLGAHGSGKRLAAAHVLFNAVTALVAVALLDPLRLLVDVLAGLLLLPEGDPLFRLALFHTVFNALGLLLFLPFIRPFARQLERWLPFETGRTAQPLFLHRTATRVPSVAIAAARNEIQHLYDNAFTLLVHGLGLRRAVVRGEQPLAEAIARTVRLPALDVEDSYEQQIKSLHGEIVAFISESLREGLAPAQPESLHVLRQASQDIVLAVKGMKHMHSNLQRLGLSGDPLIREHYDALRLLLADLLRRLETLRRLDDGDAAGQDFSALQAELAVVHRVRTGAVEQGIRDHRLRTRDATSLMNDTDYALSIARHLIAAAAGLARVTLPLDASRG